MSRSPNCALTAWAARLTALAWPGGADRVEFGSETAVSKWTVSGFLLMSVRDEKGRFDRCKRV